MKKKLVAGLMIMTLCCLIGCGDADTNDSSKEEKVQFNNSIEKDTDVEDGEELEETVKGSDEKNQLDDLQSE